jgi:CHAD domain-containing protein
MKARIRPSSARAGRKKRRHVSSPELAPGALRHVERALQKQWTRYRKELRRCQRKFSEKAVHNSRVSARRLLATIELLEEFLWADVLKKVRHLIKEHLDIFDDLRDTQVQLVAVNGLQPTLPIARIFSGWLNKREGRFRERTCSCVKRIKTKPLVKLIAVSEDALEKQLKKQKGNAAANLLIRAVSKAYSRTAQLKKKIRANCPESIHRTRVAFKRFRYMVELLADDLAADEKLLEEMQHYQTMMGDIQDAEVLLQTFDKFARKKKIRAGSASQLRDELVRRREWLTNVYLDAAGQLREFWPIRGRVT